MKTRTGEEFSLERPDCAPTPHELDGVGVGRKLSEKKTFQTLLEWSTTEPS